MDGLVLTSHRGVSPRERVAGVPLGLRAALTLQSRGSERLWIDDRELVDEIAADPRVHVAVGPWQGGDGPAVALPHHLVVEPALIDALFARGADVGTVLAVSEDSPGGWIEDCSTPEGRRRATRRLFDACRKPVDGIVSRHLNRHVSLFISRLLVDTPITPNAMTGITFSFAVAAAWLALGGGYRDLAVAGVLMQLNSILDGCDGELARVRFQGSKLGQWLDTVGDDLSNVIFWAALGYGTRTVEPSWLSYSGYLAAAANAVAALENYWILAKIGSGDFYDLDPEPPSGAMAVLGLFFKQDFFLLMVMCLALAGVLPQALPLVAAGAVITLLSSTLRAIRFARRDKR